MVTRSKLLQYFQLTVRVQQVQLTSGNKCVSCTCTQEAPISWGFHIIIWMFGYLEFLLYCSILWRAFCELVFEWSASKTNLPLLFAPDSALKKPQRTAPLLFLICTSALFFIYFHYFMIFLSYFSLICITVIYFSWGVHMVCCWSTRTVLRGVFDCNRPLYLLYCSNKKVFWICHCVCIWMVPCLWSPWQHLLKGELIMSFDCHSWENTLLHTLQIWIKKESRQSHWVTAASQHHNKTSLKYRNATKPVW